MRRLARLPVRHIAYCQCAISPIVPCIMDDIATRHGRQYNGWWKRTGLDLIAFYGRMNDVLESCDGLPDCQFAISPIVPCIMDDIATRHGRQYNARG